MTRTRKVSRYLLVLCQGLRKNSQQPGRHRSLNSAREIGNGWLEKSPNFERMFMLRDTVYSVLAPCCKITQV